MQDVERRLAFHARQYWIAIEALEGLHHGVIAALDRYIPVLGLSEQDDSPRPHAGPVPHRLGDHDLPFRPDFRRTDPVQGDPVSYHLTPHVLPI